MEQIFKPEKKVIARFGLPLHLRFSLAWTLLFTILGLSVQIISQEITIQTFYDFFGSNYLVWFRSFGSFTNPELYPTINDLIIAIASKWYYFFFTGGLISLIWALISWIINFELEITRKVRDTEAEEQVKKQKETEEEIRARKLQEHQEWANIMKESETIQKIEMLLMKGENFVKLKKFDEARKTYSEIKSIYNISFDKDKKLFQRILKFYNSILK